MNTLTNTQQNIVDSIIAEFNQINTPPTTASDDLVAFIKNQVDEKHRFRQETLLTNEAYDQANTEKVEHIISQMNAILKPFSYYCHLYYACNGHGYGFTEYFQVQIKWDGHMSEHRNVLTTDIFLHSKVATNDRIEYLVDSSLHIYKKYYKQDKIFSTDSLLKYVAELIIEKQKSLIK
jgi:hypothetical protein